MPYRGLEGPKSRSGGLTGGLVAVGHGLNLPEGIGGCLGGVLGRPSWRRPGGLVALWGGLGTFVEASEAILGRLGKQNEALHLACRF